MADPMTPERLAEIRERAESVRTWKAVWNAPVPQLCDVDIPDLLAEVKRLRHDLDVQRAAMATMLADERQMAAAHDRTRAELDAARGRMRNVRAELLAAEGRLLDARDHVNPRAKSHLDAAARHLRALADGLDGTGDGS